MKFKEILVDTLKKTVDKMITSSKVSMQEYGIEDMPQSMKEKR